MIAGSLHGPPSPVSWPVAWHDSTLGSRTMETEAPRPGQGCRAGCHGKDWAVGLAHDHMIPNRVHSYAQQWSHADQSTHLHRSSRSGAVEASCPYASGTPDASSRARDWPFIGTMISILPAARRPSAASPFSPCCPCPGSNRARAGEVGPRSLGVPWAVLRPGARLSHVTLRSAAQGEPLGKALFPYRQCPAHLMGVDDRSWRSPACPSLRRLVRRYSRSLGRVRAHAFPLQVIASGAGCRSHTCVAAACTPL